MIEYRLAVILFSMLKILFCYLIDAFGKLAVYSVASAFSFLVIIRNFIYFYFLVLVMIAEN